MVFGSEFEQMRSSFEKQVKDLKERVQTLQDTLVIERAERSYESEQLKNEIKLISERLVALKLKHQNSSLL